MTPDQLFNPFAEAALAVVPWVAGGILAAIALYFTLVGIRKGLAWFFALIGDARVGRAAIDADIERSQAWAAAADFARSMGLEDGLIRQIGANRDAADAFMNDANTVLERGGDNASAMAAGLRGAAGRLG